MNGAVIQFEDGATAFYPGDTMNGMASWRADGRVKGMMLRLVWSTAGKGTRDSKVIDSRTIETSEPVGSIPFSFIAPDSPPSLSGSLVSVMWAVEMEVKGAGLNAKVDIIISPTAEELRLSSDAAVKL